MGLKSRTAVLVWVTGLWLATGALSAAASQAMTAPDRPDNRVLMVDIARFPHEKAVGQIRATGPNRSRFCTGTAVAPRFVITVAHCLFNDKGQPYHNVAFFPGARHGAPAPMGRFPVLRQYRPVAYRFGSHTASNARFDMALLEVGPNEKGQTLDQAAATVAFRGDNGVPADSMTLIGYPNDKPLYGAYIQKQCGLHLFAHILYRTGCYATLGQSGSPVLVFDDENQRYILQGILSGVTKTDSFATRITPERQQILDQIIAGTYTSEIREPIEIWQAFPVAEPKSGQASVLGVNH